MITTAIAIYLALNAVACLVILGVPSLLHNWRYKVRRPRDLVYAFALYAVFAIGLVIGS